MEKMRGIKGSQFPAVMQVTSKLVTQEGYECLITFNCSFILHFTISGISHNSLHDLIACLKNCRILSIYRMKLGQGSASHL